MQYHVTQGSQAYNDAVLKKIFYGGTVVESY